MPLFLFLCLKFQCTYLKVVIQNPSIVNSFEGIPSITPLNISKNDSWFDHPIQYVMLMIFKISSPYTKFKTLVVRCHKLFIFFEYWLRIFFSSFRSYCFLLIFVTDIIFLDWSIYHMCFLTSFKGSLDFTSGICAEYLGNFGAYRLEDFVD